MASDVNNAVQTFKDNLFKSIDNIVKNRLTSIKFDRTLICQIVDDTNSEKGEYVVSNAGVQFLAYSENTSYKDGNWVYVTVPNDDFDQQKIIVGKYIADNTEYATYVNPLDSYIDITGNLIYGDVDLDNSIGLIANGQENEVIIWRTGTLAPQPYSSNQPSVTEYKNTINIQLDELKTQYQQALDAINSTDPNNYYITHITEKEQLLAELENSYNTMLIEYQTLLNEANEISNTISYTTQQLSQFNRLGIQAKFMTYLSKYHLISGKYGLRLDIVTTDTRSTSAAQNYKSVSLYIDNDDMFGDPYNFIDWSAQQYVFDLSEYPNIVGMQLVFFQDNNFINEDGIKIPGYKNLPEEIPQVPTLSNNPSYEEQTNYNVQLEKWNEYQEILEQWIAYNSMFNILVKDIYVSMGYSLDDFSDEALFLYSFEPLTYASYITEQAKIALEEYNKNYEDALKEDPELYAQYVEIVNRNIAHNMAGEPIEPLPEIPGIDPPFNLNVESEVQRALNFVNEKNILLRWIHFTGEEESLAVENIENIETWEKDTGVTGVTEVYPMAKIHWYHWVLQDGVEDELAGAFWQEVNLNELAIERDPSIIEGMTTEEITKAKENSYDWFEYEGFYPDPLLSREKLKVIIEYPSKDYCKYQFDNTVEDYLLDKEEELWELAKAEYFTDSSTGEIVYNENNLYHKAILQTGYNIKKEKERTSYEAVCMGDCHLYESEEIIFSNEHDVPNEATAELIRSLRLICDESGSKGVYCIYNDDGNIMNIGESTHNRIITAEFESLVTGDQNLDTAETIRWYFPMENTMIEPPAEGNEYCIYEELVPLPSNATAAQQLEYSTKQKQNNSPICARYAGLVDGGQWFCIERQGVNAEGAKVRAGDVIPSELGQIFRIKPYYTQTATNNTIRCEVYKSNRTYTAEFGLTFGVAGSNGSEYTLIIQYKQKQGNDWGPATLPVLDWNGGAIKLEPHIYDYENKEITADYINNISYELYSGSSSGLNLSTENGSYIIKSNGSNPENYYHLIVKAWATDVIRAYSTTGNSTETQIEIPTDPYTGEPIDPEPQTINLTTYCPIAVRFDSSYVKMDGDNRVTYDPSGVNPTYYKGQYALYKTEGNGLAVQEDIRWTVDLSNEDSTGPAMQYYPQIDYETGSLIVPSMYMSNNPSTCSLLAIKESTEKVVWCQPLYISQNLYASAFLNSWDGSLTIDEQNNTIMSAMIGAGFKDDENLFNGVLMGMVGEKTGVPIVMNEEEEGNEEEEIATTGLFGYNAGQQSFGFTIAGTAFLGKRGRGQIVFNGNSGQIKSALFGEPIYESSDLAFGGMRIDLDDAYMDFLSNPIPIQDEEGEDDWGQISIHMGVYDENEDEENPSVTYFNITDPYGKDLIMIHSDDFFLQSSDFDDEVETGTRLDIKTGNFTAYRFNLLTKFHREDEEIDEEEYVEDNTSEEGNTSSETDNPNDIYLNRYIKINSEAITYPLIVGTANDNCREMITISGHGESKYEDSFCVSWRGNVYAAGGRIGSAIINRAGLFISGSRHYLVNQFAGVALFSNYSDNADDNLRITVGKLQLHKEYWINRMEEVPAENASSQSDDEENAESTEATETVWEDNWVQAADINEYNDFLGQKEIRLVPDSTGSTKFMVTEKGYVYAKKIFADVQIKSSRVGSSTLDVLKIKDKLYYKGNRYKSIKRVVVTNITSATVDVKEYSLTSKKETQTVTSSYSLTKDADGNPHVEVYPVDVTYDVYQIQETTVTKNVNLHFNRYRLTYLGQNSELFENATLEGNHRI